MSDDKWKMCESKKVYNTRGQAEERARLYQRERGGSLRVYYCPYCGSYHITHKNGEL